MDDDVDVLKQKITQYGIKGLTGSVEAILPKVQYPLSKMLRISSILDFEYFLLEYLYVHL